MNKIFVKVDGTVANVDYVDTATLGDEDPMFTRTVVFPKCHPGCTKENILSEVQEIEDNFERGYIYSGLSDPILTTTLTETDNVVVALTYKGFVNIAEGFKDMNVFKHSTRKERYESLARELERKI